MVDGPGPTSDSSHRGSILIYDEYGYDAADPEEWVDDWITPARFAPYLDACGGDTDKALDLYEWNMAVGQILDRDINHFEMLDCNRKSNTARVTATVAVSPAKSGRGCCASLQFGVSRGRFRHPRGLRRSRGGCRRAC